MPADDMIRASDADREHTVAVLGAGYTAGRLTLAEFDDRITAAFTSRTWGELRRLTRDLPSWPGRPGTPGDPRSARAGPGDQAPAAPRTGTAPVLLALYWLGLSVAAHAADVLIPAVLVLLMVVWAAARLR